MGRDLRFAVIGAGMAGILAAIKLQQSEMRELTVYEKADRLGGTWRENTYPGLCCDVPSHLYCYSFAPNPEWSHLMSSGSEILKYLDRVARTFGVHKYIRFDDEVVSCEFIDGCWHLTTASGHHDVADVVIAATGVLHHPKYPDIDGLESFEGKMFHSSRWDHSAALDRARVGIIGTGSTAVQIVSAIVDRTATLTLFQRTAQWVLPAPNPEYTEAEREAFRRDPQTMKSLRAEVSALFDGFSGAIVDADSSTMKLIEESCRSNLEDHVVDPVLRSKLRPNYRPGCKRLIVSPDFYDAIQRPNAEIVTEAIDHVEPRGVRTNDGRLHELDILVLATGFHVDAFVRPINVVGRNRQNLDTVWGKRPEAYMSISVPEFPNFFMLNGPNGPVGNFSLIEVAELQLGYVMQLVERISAGECREISATTAALQEFEAARVKAAENTVWATGCRSWYLDDRGIPAAWPWPFQRFREEMATPKWEAYEIAR